MDGIEVVEFCSAVAGPFAGKLLADFGANVTRIEPTRGSLMRTRRAWYDTHEHEEFTYRFLPYNTGKRSLAVDLKSEAGTEIVWDLLAKADVVVENMRKGIIDRLGFGWDAVHERHPDVIYCSVSGYGQDGPYSEWPAYDPVIQGVGAWAHYTGDGDHPQLTDVIAIDHATALYATVGILMALWERQRGGGGQRIDVSMFETAISFLGHQFGEYSAVQALEDVEPAYVKNVEPIGIYEAADDYLTVLAPPEYWEEFCAVIDREAFADEAHRFGTLDKRIQHSADLHDQLRPLFGERTVEEWMTVFSEEAPGVVCAPVNTVPDLPEDPHVQTRESVVTREHPELGEYTMPGPVMRFSRTPGEVGHAPGIGEHTDVILEALGYTDEEIAQLREDGVIR
jgi:crotonobetainyl-CoA:carnitine CoA-transferase CaiB-like acyl-CoA transferase